MRQAVEKIGKSIEEAIQLALEELRCTRDELEVEILTAPAKGFLGILGAKDAKIRAWRKPAGEGDESSVGSEPAGTEDRPSANTQVMPKRAASDVRQGSVSGDKIVDFITRVTTLMGVEATVEKKETAETLCYTLSGPKMGAVIGRRGDTLDALQYLSNIIAGKGQEESRKRIVVDAEDYRRRREETLIRLATRLATKAKKSGRRVVLEPMSPMERRMIHTALQTDPEIRTQSEGEEPYRRLVIYPAAGGREAGPRYDREGGVRGGGYGGGQRRERPGARRSGSAWGSSAGPERGEDGQNR